MHRVSPRYPTDSEAKLYETTQLATRTPVERGMGGSVPRGLAGLVAHRVGGLRGLGQLEAHRAQGGCGHDAHTDTDGLLARGVVALVQVCLLYTSRCV